VWGWLAQNPAPRGMRFAEGTCGSPRPTTKGRGPTEQVRATIAHLSRLVERHPAREHTRDAGCRVPGAGAGAGRYEKLSAPRFLPTTYWLLPTPLMRPSAPARRAGRITARLKSRPSADGLESEPCATFSSRGARPEAERSPRRPLHFHQCPWNPNP
jgi:hypothetical protein